MDEGKAEHRDQVADYGDDDDANYESHCVVGDGGEDLAHHDDIDDYEAASDDDVED